MSAGTGGGVDVEMRPMRPEDEPEAVEVSSAADTLFAEAGLILPPDDPRELFAHAEHTLVAIDPAAGRVRGLAATVTVDGCPHLEQLAVDPAHGRRGIGSALLEEVCSRARAAGHDAVTLTTFRDLAWNGPWYGQRGFDVLPRAVWGPGLTRLWGLEAAIRVAPRVVMVRVLAG